MWVSHAGKPPNFLTSKLGCKQPSFVGNAPDSVPHQAAAADNPPALPLLHTFQGCPFAGLALGNRKKHAWPSHVAGPRRILLPTMLGAVLSSRSQRKADLLQCFPRGKPRWPSHMLPPFHLRHYNNSGSPVPSAQRYSSRLPYTATLPDSFPHGEPTWPFHACPAHVPASDNTGSPVPSSTSHKKAASDVSRSSLGGGAWPGCSLPCSSR